MEGADDVVTVKATPLLTAPLMVTITFPPWAPSGTDVAMLVGLQLVVVAAFLCNPDLRFEIGA